MSTITIPGASLRALINVCKASLEIKQTIELGAIGVSDEGEPVWEESLDCPDLGICYFELSKALDQAKSEIARLEKIIDSPCADSSGLKLSADIEGQETDDLQSGLEEILRLVREDFTSGLDRNETGSYRFSITGYSISGD
ncbi:hypothetical protein [Methylobacter tundripaludum]|uniref:hypothetical protein n=1 Tax=Methylobacter tundripaludum TaxID=173365 RepID=UPI00047F9B64|nr:hypothetical protein [Methylobacter tundripaludum]